MWNPLRSYRESLLRRQRQVESDVADMQLDIEALQVWRSKLSGKLRHRARADNGAESEEPVLASASMPAFVPSSPSETHSDRAPLRQQLRDRARSLGLLPPSRHQS